MDSNSSKKDNSSRSERALVDLTEKLSTGELEDLLRRARSSGESFDAYVKGILFSNKPELSGAIERDEASNQEPTVRQITGKEVVREPVASEGSKGDPKKGALEGSSEGAERDASQDSGDCEGGGVSS